MTNSLSDLQAKYYASLGYTGSMSDMQYAYYSNPPSGGGFTKVANAAALPAPSAGNAGVPYYVSDTNVSMVNDGTRWRTMYGDTGLRQINAWNGGGTITDGPPLQAGWKPRTSFGGTINLRRTNNTVFLYIDNLACAVANTGNPIYTVPAGYSVDQNTIQMVASFTSANVYSPLGLNVQGGPVLRAANTPIAVDQYIQGVMIWSTYEPWPTTLPGSPGLPPN